MSATSVRADHAPRRIVAARAAVATRGGGRASSPSRRGSTSSGRCVPVLLAIRFAFNSGRSRTSLQGWSLRWFWKDPTLSVFHDPTLQAALEAQPRARRARDGDRHAAGHRAGARHAALARAAARARRTSLLLLPLVTPELVFAVGMFLLFTTAFGFIGLGTTAQAIGQVTFTLSWVVLIVRGRLATIGRDVEEAAADLGAPPLHVVAARAAAAAAAGDGGEPAGRPSRCRSTTSSSASTSPRAPTRRRCRCASTRRRAAAPTPALNALASDHARGLAARARARVPRVPSPDAAARSGPRRFEQLAMDMG